MRFLADNQSYYDFLKGLDNLTVEQKQVLFERLKSEVNKSSKSIIDTTAEIIDIINEPVQIVHREFTDKPKSVIECCLHCGSIRIKKHGTTKGGVQRYICKDCNKSFSENYGLITHYTHLAEWQWLEAIRGSVCGSSITDIAKNMNVSLKTAWLCRMKIYQTIKNIYGYCDTFNSIVEADGKYERISFKGLKDKSYFIDKLGRLPRHHRSKSQRIEYLGDDYKRLFVENPKLLKEMIYSSQKRMVGRDTIDANHQHVCILTAIDRSNNIYVEPVSAGTAKSHDVYDKLQPRITNEAVLITDEHNSYKYLCREEMINHVVVESKSHSFGAYNLSRVNSLHSAIERFLGSKECKPATKYLDLYLMMFWWIEKNKDIGSNALTDKLFAIMTGCVSNDSRAKMHKVTFDNLVSRPLPIDTKGFF